MHLIGSSGPALPNPLPVSLRWRRRLQRCRRPVAALLLAAASGVAVHAAARAQSPAPQARVVVASRDLPGGRVLAVADVSAALLPRDAVPSGASATPSQLVGRSLSGAVRRGEVLTDARTTGPGILVGLPPGQMAVPVQVERPLPDGLLAVGDAVSVLAGPGDDLVTDGLLTSATSGGTSPGGSEVLVERARVLALPAAGEGGGLLGGSSSPSGQSGVVVLALDAAAATRVAAADGRRALTLALLAG